MPKHATKPLPPLHERLTRARRMEIMQHQKPVLDGAYRSAFQNNCLPEQASRGESYAHHDQPLHDDHDIMNLTQPQIVAEFHNGYLGLVATSSPQSYLTRSVLP